ncbi:glycosyltransferase family 2 protein [Marinilactibacillus sp. XAAS-LB27]|uniref:glycosyltransferase family 2 protein n=1 Tax=Marinilactibacillus sp. XAAS-LB27 TaxID=3114538 RepID=UPI002E181B27|nr:glycosyltransferase family 2 protein [Marinilactibacillus sp. XAAS-LB27]
MTRLTLLTPTYNRKEFLNRIYESMTIQVNPNFQWLIIDDGSTDGTDMVVKEIIKNHKQSFQINYRKKSNGGKHSALNYAHEFIAGDYVMVLDSDDFLNKNAVNIILNKIDKYQHSTIGWFAFLKGNKDGSVFDVPYNGNAEIMTYSTYMNKSRKGECSDVYLRKVFTSFPYPEIIGEKFISESYLNIQACLYGKYKMITFNDVVQLVEYMEDGLTLEGRLLQIKNPKGHAELWKHVRGFDFSFKQKLKGSWLYITYSLFANKTLKEILNNSYSAVFTFMNFPFGLCIYIIWKNKYLKNNF